MRRALALLAGMLLAFAAAAQLPKLDELLKGAGKLPQAGTTVGSGDERTATSATRR